jgi:hypothetical protein
MEYEPEDRLDLHRYPEARLPHLVFGAFASKPSEGARVYCRTLAEAVERLAQGLHVLRQLAGLERQPGDP